MTSRWPLLLGYAALAVLVLGIGGWGSLTTISGAVRAPAVIAIEGEARTIEHPENGVVTALMVRDGDTVEPGETLFLIETTDLAAEAAALDRTLYELRVRAARLRAERDGLATLPNPAGGPPPGLPETEAARIRRDEQLAFETALSAFRTEAGQIRNLQSQIAGQIAGHDRQRAALGREAALIGDDLARGSRLHAAGLAPIGPVNALRQRAARAERDLAEIDAARAEAAARIAALDLEALRGAERRRATAASDLQALRTEMQAVEERRDRIARDIDRRTIRAPIRGIVVDVRAGSIGTVIAAGEPLLRIVPAHRTLHVEARIRPRDVVHVRAGQAARVRVAVADPRSTAPVEARVRHVSADVVAGPPGTEPHYLAVLDLVAPDGSGTAAPLLPGLPAEVAFATAPRRPIALLADPFLRQIGNALGAR